jgi:hypothetical protein
MRENVLLVGAGTVLERCVVWVLSWWTEMDWAGLEWNEMKWTELN